jgi:hypothetical protein
MEMIMISKNTLITLSLLSIINIVTLSTQSLKAMAITPSLSEFYKNATGAFVLPYTTWKKPEGMVDYVILGQEAFGTDKGTYDAFGGSKEKNEVHPLQTAAREMSEESIGLLGSPSALEKHLDIDKGNTKNIIANKNKKVVVYISHFDHKDIEDFKKKFENARQKTTKKSSQEKTSLAIVRWKNFENTVANAKRDAQGKLITPITMQANVVKKDGTEEKKTIILRPVMVSALQSYFKGIPGTPGKNKQILFYDK